MRTPLPYIATLVFAAGPLPAADHWCGAPDLPSSSSVLWGGPAPGTDAAETDCSMTRTVPAPVWLPTHVLRIPVVVHVIRDGACRNGNLTDAAVASQIAVLNEDFRAVAGTNGGPGFDTQIEFFLATTDPQGRPTTGITRSCNSNWYADRGQYWNTLAWDPRRYLNVYTNTAANARGYVPFLPAAPTAAVGQRPDRVVINWMAFGRGGPIPHHAAGRTATHEIGHYLGLFHPYYEGCGGWPTRPRVTPRATGSATPRRTRRPTTSAPSAPPAAAASWPPSTTTWS